jgi:hypothetical protein
MRRLFLVALVWCGLLAVAGAAQTASKPQTVKNLQITVTAVERTEKASLRDCPPGTNTVNAVARAGEQLSVVTVAFKVLPGFQSMPMKRPVVTAADDKTYNTSVQFVDVGSVPEYSCTFPFRVPEGTKLKSLQIEGTSFDLSALESKTP